MLIWFESCDGSLKFPVKLNKTYQISRPAKAPIAVGSDVIVVKLRDDKSISRKHANFQLNANQNSAVFELNDESKYSSKIRNGDEDWQKVIGEHSIDLDLTQEINIGIHFGIYNSKFKMYGRPLSIQNPLALYPNHLRSFSIQNETPSFILVDLDSLDERTKETIRQNIQKFQSAKLLDAKIASQLSKWFDEPAHFEYHAKVAGIVLDEFFIDQHEVGLTEDDDEEIEGDLEDEDEEEDNDPLNTSTDSTTTTLTAIMKPEEIDYGHESSQKTSAKRSGLGQRKRCPQNSEPETSTGIDRNPLSGFHMPSSQSSNIVQKPVQKSPLHPDRTQQENETSSSFQQPQTREKISAKNRATTIIQSQRRLQNTKKAVLSQAATILIGSSDSSSDEEMELTYKSQRLRTSTQAPGGAPIAKIISGSSQSQVKIQNKVQNTVLNESTAIVPDTQNETVKPIESKNVPKTGQSESVIPDSDEVEESSSENQTGLTRMSQSPVRDRQSKQRNYLGKTSCIPATEYSGSPPPPPKSNPKKKDQIIQDSDELDESLSHETHQTRLSRLSQSPVRDRHSKKRHYSGKTTCVPATEYTGSPAPPSKSDKSSSRAKEEIPCPKFDVANENDLNDLENSKTLFDESSKFEKSVLAVKNEPESSVPESIRQTNPSYKSSLFGKEKKSFKIRKFDKSIVARKAFKSNNNTEYDLYGECAVQYFFYNPANHEETDQPHWPDITEEMKKEAESFMKDEVIEVQVQKKSNKQTRNDTVSNLGSQMRSQMQSGTFGKRRFDAADL